MDSRFAKRQRLPFQRESSRRGLQCNGYYWLRNGFVELGQDLRDPYRSTDSVTWELVNSATPYDAYSGVASFNGYM